MKYEIVSAFTKKGLSEKVNLKLAKRYKLAGGHARGFFRYSQAVYR